MFIGSYMLESTVDLIRNKGQSFSSFWQNYDIVKSFLMTIGSIMFFTCSTRESRAKYSGNAHVNLGATIFVIGATLSLMKPLRWLLLNRWLGPIGRRSMWQLWLQYSNLVFPGILSLSYI